MNMRKQTWLAMVENKNVRPRVPFKRTQFKKMELEADTPPIL